MTASEGTCQATPGCRAPQQVGLICRTHHDRTRTLLTDIIDEAALLSAVPSMQLRTGTGHASLASERAPGRLEAMILRDGRANVRPYDAPPAGPACATCWHETCMIIRNYDDAYNAGALDNMSVLSTLHFWAAGVRAVRRFPTVDRPTIVGESELLTRQLPWIAEQPHIADLYDDLTRLHHQLHAANGRRPDHPHSRCPVTTTTGPCPGHIWIHDELQPVWRRYTDRCAATYEQAPGPAVCDTCAATWTTDADKARLQRMISDAATELARPVTADGQRMLTAAELVAAGHASTLVQVRVVAHRLGHVSVRGHYDPRWYDTQEMTA